MNDKIINNLERYYKGFIDQQDNWAFFLGLAYYVDFVLETPETKKITDLLVQERINEENKTKKLGDGLLKEVKPVKEILFKKIKDAGISYPELNYEIQDYEEHESGKAVSSNPLPVMLAECVHDIIWSLSQNGHKELIKDFITERHGIVYIDKHEFSKKWRAYEKQKQDYADKKEIALWGLWGYICFAYVAVLKADEELAKIKKDRANWFRILNLRGYFGEMKEIKEGETNDIIEFKKEKYKSHATIINSYLIKELSRDERLEALQALTEKTDEEIKEIMRGSIDNVYVPSSIYHKAKQELDFRNTERNNKKEPLEISTNEVVPDRTAEIERQINEARKWEADRALKEKQHKELLKQNRILATKENKYIHAIDTIIERAGLGNENFSIDYYYFNFEDRMDASKMLEKFLLELQNNGCFEKYIRTNYARGVRFSFIKNNIIELKKFRKSLENGKIQKGERFDNKQIEKITLIELKNGKYLLAVNDDYKSVKKIRKSKYYPIFIEEVSKREILNRTDNHIISDEMAEYFNTNKKCIIYMNGKYPLKTIFTGNEDEREINWEVKTEIIDEATYLRQIKKVNKK